MTHTIPLTQMKRRPPLMREPADISLMKGCSTSWNMLLKVYSHQLDENCKVKIQGQQPMPNLFVTSANQFADNAATQTRGVLVNPPPSFDTMFYPSFSPRWCFTVEGRITNRCYKNTVYAD
jgi:hypothetical protein